MDIFGFSLCCEDKGYIPRGILGFDNMLWPGAKYIAKNGMDLILLLMASRWVQDGFNIGFGRRSQDGLKIALGSE